MQIESDPKNDLWAFREGRKSVSGPTLFRQLVGAVNDLCAHPTDNSLAISALMRAGEFESALADANCLAKTPAQQLTNALASTFLGETTALGGVVDLDRHPNEPARIAGSSQRLSTGRIRLLRAAPT